MSDDGPGQVASSPKTSRAAQMQQLANDLQKALDTARQRSSETGSSSTAIPRLSRDGGTHPTNERRGVSTAEKLAALQALVSPNAFATDADNLFDEIANDRIADCVALVRYRDDQLVRDWDSHVQRLLLVEDLVRDLQAIRSELLEYEWWTVSSIPEIALALKTFSDIVYGVVATASPGGKAVDFSKQLLNVSIKRHDVAARGAKLLKTTMRGSYLVQEEFGKVVWSLLSEELGAMGAAANLLKNTAENLERARTLPREKSETRLVVTERLQAIDKQTSAIIATTTGIRNNVEIINGLRDAIDLHCGNASVTPPLRSTSVP